MEVKNQIRLGGLIPNPKLLDMVEYFSIPDPKLLGSRYPIRMI